MKKSIAGLTLFFMTACANQLSFIGSHNAQQTRQDNVSGQHTALAQCILIKLQSDARSFMRVLQFRIRTHPDTSLSEIHAFDLRYLPNVYATNSPTNPDAAAVTIESDPETLPYSPRSQSGEPIYAFALTLKQIDDITVYATLKGDPYLSNIAWSILRDCASERALS